MSKIKVTCNSSTEEHHSQLKNERIRLEQKLLVTCEKESTSPVLREDFLNLKFGNESEIMQKLFKSETPSLKNDYCALMMF